jgi:hypothetical protein
MDTSGLTGSDLEDKLLQDVLLYSCMTDTVYSSGYEDWVAYSDIPAEPVTVESGQRHLRRLLTEPAPAPTPETTPEPTPEPTPNYSPSIECISVTGTSDVDTTVSVHFDFEGVTTSYSVIAGPDGLFEYTLTDPVAGYYNNCSSF